MRTYPDQPVGLKASDEKALRRVVDEILLADLPDCTTNNWFLCSVNYANMLDKIVADLG